MNVMAYTGRFFLTIAFNGVFIYSAEIYPTEVRHVGMATASVTARIGGMIAPYMGPPVVGACMNSTIMLLVKRYDYKIK